MPSQTRRYLGPVRKTLSRSINNPTDLIAVASQELRPTLTESYSHGDPSCWPHLFLSCEYNGMSYFRLELPERDYHDQIGRTVAQLCLEYGATIYALAQEFAFSKTIMNRNGLLIQAGYFSIAGAPSQRIVTRTFWIDQYGQMEDAELSLDDFNSIVLRHKRAPIRQLQ